MAAESVCGVGAAGGVCGGHVSIVAVYSASWGLVSEYGLFGIAGTVLRTGDCKADYLRCHHRCRAAAWYLDIPKSIRRCGIL